MRRGRVLAVVLVGALGAPVVAWSQQDGDTQPAAPSPKDTGATFFRDAIVKDVRTASTIRKLLQSGAGFVDPASQYGDLTGDGKPDAAVRVDTGGAMGAVAVYVFSADGVKSGDLRIVYRNQHQVRVTTRVANGILTLSSPTWKRGDDVCCASGLRELDYRWSADRRTMVRTGDARAITPRR
jgi:hypothetical protein